MKRFWMVFFFIPQFLIAQQVKFYHTYGQGIFDSGEGVLISNDTGYVVGGITTPMGGTSTDVLIYKTDSLGVLQWYKHIGGSGIEGAHGITQPKNKNEYILVGYQNNLDTSGYNVYVVKTDTNGDTLWTKAYGGADWDMAYSVDTLQDSTYIVAGETFSFGNGNMDVYLLRIDKNGDTLWTRTYGGSNDDYARYVYTDRHDNIVVTGTTNSFGAGGTDVYLLYLNSSGDTLWTKTYGGTGDEYGYSGDMYINNGGFLSFSFGYTQYDPLKAAQDARLVRMDSTGAIVIIDQSIFGTNSEIYDHIIMRRSAKGRFYHTGDVRYTQTGPTDIYMHYTLYNMVFNPGYEAFVTEPGDFEWPKDIRRCIDQGFIITGTTQSYGPGPQATFLLKTDSLFNTITTPVVAIDEIPVTAFSIYPNPVFNDMIQVESSVPFQEIRVFNMNGQIVFSKTYENSFHEFINLGDVSSGVYIAEIRSENSTGRKKLIVQ